jgi:hypothetical protein
MNQVKLPSGNSAYDQAAFGKEVCADAFAKKKKKCPGALYASSSNMHSFLVQLSVTKNIHIPVSILCIT